MLSKACGWPLTAAHRGSPQQQPAARAPHQRRQGLQAGMALATGAKGAAGAPGQPTTSRVAVRATTVSAAAAVAVAVCAGLT